MKSLFMLVTILAASPALVSGAGATGASKTQPTKAASEKIQPGFLQVAVNVPASLRPWVSDKIAEAFAARVADTLHQRGAKTEIRYVDSFDQPTSRQPLLEINLIEWRSDHIGNAVCTFSAGLSTPQGKKSLGLFTGTSMMMFSRHDWPIRGDQFEDAARQALVDLYKRITETRLLRT